MHVSRHSNHTTLCMSFFELSSTAGYLLSGFRQPSHPARIFSGIFPDPFYLLPATLVQPEWAYSGTGLFVTKLRNRLKDESVLQLSCVSIINIIAKLCL